MIKILDICSIIFWSITYALIVYYGICYRTEKKIMIPLLNGVLNFSWELNAVILAGMWGQILWFVLDVPILILNFFCIEKGKQTFIFRVAYIISIFISCSLFYFLFRCFSDSMLLSSFVIDLIMAAFYLVNVKRISRHGQTLIAVSKLIGDLAAWIAYMNSSWIVAVIGAIVFIVNLLYLCFCLEYSNFHKAKKTTRKVR